MELDASYNTLGLLDGCGLLFEQAGFESQPATSGKDAFGRREPPPDGHGCPRGLTGGASWS